MKGSETFRYGLPEDAINQILLGLADYPGIERVILYGSRAQGNFRPSSDIDLCMHAPTLYLTQQLAIEHGSTICCSHGKLTWSPTTSAIPI